MYFYFIFLLFNSCNYYYNHNILNIYNNNIYIYIYLISSLYSKNMIIGKKYEILNKIGNGAFGSIYKGKNIRTNEIVAIKVEPIKSNTKLLKNETKIYQYLSGFNYTGIPQIKWFGVDETNYYMVISLLGPSLLQLKQKKNTFSLNIIISMTIQILERLQFIHEKGLIHRDIKPDNFLIGEGNNKNKIYLIDFGFCKKYVKEDGTHVNIKKISKIIGTPIYVSVNVHDLIEPSRRDDIESLVYIMMYFYYGELEWSEITIYSNDVLERIKLLKLNIINKKETHEMFIKMLLYVRKLNFEETPDYNYLKNTCLEYKNNK